MRLTNNWASKNLKVVFESITVFIMKKLGRDFINVLCSLTPGSKYSGTVNRSLCNSPKIWISLLALSLSRRVMNPRSFAAVRVLAVGSLVPCRPVPIPVRVREIRGCCIGAVGQLSLEIRTIIIVLTRLRGGDPIESEVKLT